MNDYVNVLGISLLTDKEYERYFNIIPKISNRHDGSLMSFFLRPEKRIDPSSLVPIGSNEWKKVKFGQAFGAFSGVRPALKVETNLKAGDKFWWDGYTWTMITPSLALCDYVFNVKMPYMYFELSVDGIGFCDYEDSSIKMFLDRWLDAASKRNRAWV